MTDRERTIMVGSFAISVLLFWFMLGNVFTALAFLVLLAIHEFGHYWAAKYTGMRVKPPVFTPFGAFIQMLEMPQNAAQEAFVGYGGPFLGTVGALGALVLGVALGSSPILVAAKYALFLNLFNLIPLAPLDGGRIGMALHRKIWVLGVAAFAFMLYVEGIGMLLSPFNLFIFAYIGMQAYKDVKMREVMAYQWPSYFQLPMQVRVLYGALYIGLAAFLGFALMNFGALSALLSRVL